MILLSNAVAEGLSQSGVRKGHHRRTLIGAIHSVCLVNFLGNVGHGLGNGKCGKCAAWMYVSEDKSEALVTFVVIRTSIHPVYFLKLRGLEPDAVYVDEATGKEYYGDTLMRAGLNLTANYHDGDSVVVHLIKK